VRSRQLAAVHESAHCIAAVVDGAEIAHVWIDDAGAGACRRRGGARDLAVRLRADLAGIAAELMAQGRESLTLDEVASHTAAIPDVDRARGRCGPGGMVALERAWDDARAFVRSRWDAIERLARELYAEGHIVGPRVVELVSESAPVAAARSPAEPKMDRGRIDRLAARFGAKVDGLDDLAAACAVVRAALGKEVSRADGGYVRAAVLELDGPFAPQKRADARTDELPAAVDVLLAQGDSAGMRSR
jgi:hypothetical protein